MQKLMYFDNILRVLKHTLSVFICLCFFAVNMIACSEELSEKEKQYVNQYTKQADHDSSILGNWFCNQTIEWKGKIRKSAISFDQQGMNKERLYEESKPFNDWHLNYYYYTKKGKIFLYRPAEKGIFAMDGEVFLEYAYQITEDGKLLTLGDKTYTKVILE